MLIITFLFSWGCNKNNDIKLDNIENTENVVRELEDVIALQLNAINEGNINKYMSTINQSEVEYVAERKSWFRDAVANKINSLSIKLIKTETIGEDEILAQLLQTYKFNGKAYMLNYSLRFIKQNDRWLDSGLDFKTIETDHFVINYLQGLKENAILASQGAEEAYNNIADRIGLKPKDKTVVKLYDDKELLRQSVKLSFGWQFAGWYEFPESIKTMVYGTKDDYRKVIEHELTHKITIGLSNNNMPYWLSEGLAMYYTEYYNKDFRVI